MTNRIREVPAICEHEAEQPMNEGTTPANPGNSGAEPALWLDCCRRVVARQKTLFKTHPDIASRSVYDGVGAGGDNTLEIDRAAEDIIFDELDRLHAEGINMRAIAEERGEIAFGDIEGAPLVVIDPIDGSMNARRTVPSHAFCLAVARSDSIADVTFGYVYDFGADEEFWAAEGEGAWLDDTRLVCDPDVNRFEIVAIEAANPTRLIPMLGKLEGHASRLRVIGSIAISLCYVAAGRFDAMLTARPCRSVDAAAAQLVVREAGGVIEIPDRLLTEAELGLHVRYHMTAAVSDSLMPPLREAQIAAGPGSAPAP